jgi:hypothetical protein
MQAFGPDGLGLLTVSGIPGFCQLRERLLPLAEAFAVSITPDLKRTLRLGVAWAVSRCRMLHHAHRIGAGGRCGGAATAHQSLAHLAHPMQPDSKPMHTGSSMCAQNLPPEARAQHEDRESNYSFGWSHGKEAMVSGRPDVLKGSFYANPTSEHSGCARSAS